VLASHRNVLLRVDVGMSLLAVLAGGASAVVGVFGMNLKSGLEDDQQWFFVVVAATCGAIAVIGASTAIILFMWLLPGGQGTMSAVASSGGLGSPHGIAPQSHDDDDDDGIGSKLWK